MSQLVKKENLVIVIREYEDNQNPGKMKKVYKTVGEIITWRGDDGSEYQSFEMWGPTGSTQGKVFSQDNQNQQAAPPQSGYQQPQQGGYQQQPPQGGYPQNNGYPQR